MKRKVLIMFPYSGYDKGSPREAVFWNIVKCSTGVTHQPPIVILNRDTERRGQAKAFLAYIDNHSDKVVVRRTWSVDTCQMWLSGWGKILDADKADNDDRIIQLPGDLDFIEDQNNSRSGFFNKLETFIALPDWDFIIGDFTSGDIFSAKELIDWYGTYALMANWFPEIAQKIRQLPLNKPRSEFLNIRVGTLSELLNYRKFAYEQTLNMLIRCWDAEKKDWRYRIKSQELGTLKDDSSFRQYRDCLDQIERIERMLKLLWREMHDPLLKNNPQEFMDQYERYDRRSTSIRDNARIIIRNILSLSQMP